MKMKAFHEIQASDLNPNTMQQEIGSKGYVLIRGLLPRNDLRNLLDQVTRVLSWAGWLKSGSEAIERMANIGAACGDPDPSFKRTYRQVFSLESFHALPHHPQMQSVMKMLVGDRVLIHPKPIGRLIFPQCEKLTVHAHQDYRFMNGDPECFTAWIPLHDCPVEVGPLQILEGSHLFGFQNHVDANLHVPEIPAEAEMGDEWVSGNVNAGDVLIFHSLTVHRATPNRSNKMRISLDCRFQDYLRAINPSNLAFGGESGKSWEEIYANWSSRKLKYYWKSLPLNLQPSRDEIKHLAATADDPAMRVRYVRILSQIA